MSEADVQALVIDAAHMGGWLVAHFRPARVTRKGREVYETPVEADGRGFPDLVLVHRERGLLAFLECKGRRGRVRPDQAVWLRALGGVSDGTPRVLAWVVTPENVDTVVRLLLIGWDVGHGA